MMQVLHHFIQLLHTEDKRIDELVVYVYYIARSRLINNSQIPSTNLDESHALRNLKKDLPIFQRLISALQSYNINRPYNFTQ